MNEKININEGRTKNEVRVIGSNEQSYMNKFERLLNDDIDQFVINQTPYETNQVSLRGPKGKAVI